jgi:hypothetical protein
MIKLFAVNPVPRTCLKQLDSHICGDISIYADAQRLRSLIEYQGQRYCETEKHEPFRT